MTNKQKMLFPIVIVAVFKLVIGEGNCSVPWVWNGNFEVSSNRSLMGFDKVPAWSVLPHNTLLNLACQQDHLVIGLDVSRNSIQCKDGKWLPDPVCLKRDCSVPWISNGKIEEVPSERYQQMLGIFPKVPVGVVPPDNTTLFLSCDEGYFILGHVEWKTQITCSVGKWTPQPVCLKRPCIVPFVPNGRMERHVLVGKTYQYIEIPVGGGTQSGEGVYFSCNKVGVKSWVVCRDNIWSKELKCEPSTTTLVLRSPPGPSNTAQNLPAIPEQVDEGNCSCTYNSRQILLHAVVNGKRLRYDDQVRKGDKVKLSCRSRRMYMVLPNGTTTSGRVIMTCDNCRRWKDNDLPSCKEHFPDACTATLPSIEFGKVELFHTGIKVIANYTCDEQYVMVGRNEIHCVFGHWRGQVPKCEKTYETRGCLLEDLIENTQLHLMPDIEVDSSELLPTGSEVPLKCEQGMGLIGDKKAICDSFGKWEYGESQCILGCHKRNLDVSHHLIMEPAKEFYKFGEFVILSCPLGQTMTRRAESIMCIGSDTWTDHFPGCI